MYEYDYDEWEERVERFADPGGESALYAADKDNPRDLPCPTCGWPNQLTARDEAAGYQCDACANAAERGHDVQFYDPAIHGTPEEWEKEEQGDAD